MRGCAKGLSRSPRARSLSHAANLLWMLKGEKPSADAAQLIDRDLVLHAEHGSNASSFTARVVIGTEANLHAAVTAAIAALSGPAHGGAAEDVMKMAEEIGDPSRAADYVRDKRKAGEAVTGFGHRVYRAEDPRARHMRAGVERLSKEMGQPRWYEILQAVVAAMAPYARHGVNVNVDFYSGVVYHLLGIKRDLFVPIFAIGRVPGWVVQALEQMENNILIRPLTLYSGPDARAYVPLERRADLSQRRAGTDRRQTHRGQKIKSWMRGRETGRDIHFFASVTRMDAARTIATDEAEPETAGRGIRGGG